MGAALVITPNVEDEPTVAGALAPGVPRLTMLNAFVPYALNFRLKRSLSLKSREIARSISRNPGASRKLRGELPSVATPVTNLFWMKAEVLNHIAADGLSMCGSP